MASGGRGEPVYGHEVPPEGLRDSLELILLLESLFNMEKMLPVQPAPPRCSGQSRTAPQGPGCSPALTDIPALGSPGLGVLEHPHT